MPLLSRWPIATSTISTSLALPGHGSRAGRASVGRAGASVRDMTESAARAIGRSYPAGAAVMRGEPGRTARGSTMARVTSPPDNQATNTAYEDLLRRVMADGTPKSDRTGTGTRSVFAQQLRFDLEAGFPLITTKRVHFRSIAYELLWFLRGDRNVGWLREHGVTIWDEWADAAGDLGPVYGVQWRAWPAPDGSHIDQISDVLRTLRTDPNSRRLIVSAWNVGEIPQMALPP